MILSRTSNSVAEEDQEDVVLPGGKSTVCAICMATHFFQFLSKWKKWVATQCDTQPFQEWLRGEQDPLRFTSEYRRD